MADDRVRRPSLDRRRPIRNWTTTVGRDLLGQGTPGVQNANRVVEEYLRAGEASARLFQGTSGGGAGSTPQDLAQGMLRAASDMMTFWLELMGRTAAERTPNGAAAGASTRPSTAEPDAERASELLSIEVDSARPTTVTLDLRPSARRSRLRLERLHPRGFPAAPLAGARVEGSDGGSVRLRLRVRDAQPAGVYDGVITDLDTSLPVGTVSVAIDARGTAPRRRRAK